MVTTKLNELLTLLHINCNDERIILGISDDSRCVEKDWIFICRRMYQKEPLRYQKEALEKGAVVIDDRFCEEDHIYCCSNVEHIIQVLLELYYGNICEDMVLIGITGTNGKTSVAALCEQLFRKQGYETLRIGTHEVIMGDHQFAIANTTPGCFTLANIIREAKSRNIRYVVMEVSSHAIDQNRICFLCFDIIIYTNISQDHLDYHKTQLHYRYTKFKLRRYLKKQGIIIYNYDQTYMEELVAMVQHPCISIGITSKDHTIESIELREQNCDFVFDSFVFHMPLSGMFHIYNLCEALLVMHLLHIPYEKLQKDVLTLTAIHGRMEVIAARNFHIWIDYAHTAYAVEALLAFAKSIAKHHIILVIGCGGDRDKRKRSRIGETAIAYCDRVIFTADNIRSETVGQIVHDMYHGYEPHVEVFENRYFAIKHAVKIAAINDIIIIAGKGNETTQEILKEHYPFHDRDVVLERLKKEELL